MTTDEPDEPDELDPDYAAATAQALAEDETFQEATEPTEPQPQLHVSPPSPLSPEEKATQLRDAAPAGYLYAAAVSLFQDGVDLASSQLYLQQLLQEAGNPADPVARMMIEQLAMAHHAIGRLHVRAATRVSLAEVVAYHGVLARMMSEFRKTSLALQGLCKNAGEQAGRRDQQAPQDRPPPAGPVSAGGPAAAAASAGSEVASNEEGEGRDRRTKCA